MFLNNQTAQVFSQPGTLFEPDTSRGFILLKDVLTMVEITGSSGTVRARVGVSLFSLSRVHKGIDFT